MKYLLEGEETERLRFRLLKPGDFDTWVKLFMVPGVSRFIGMEESQPAEAKCTKWFERIFYRYENNLGGMNVLLNKHTNEFIGQCGILVQNVNGINEFEIAYSILPDYWNLGYATEAARKCLSFAFENNFSNRLISIIHIENHRSEKVAVKSSLKFSQACYFMNMPVKIYEIQKLDWEIEKHARHISSKILNENF